MEIPNSVKRLMDENPELKTFIEMLLNKIEQIEKKLDAREKGSLSFYKPNLHKRHKKSGRKQGHEGTSRHVPEEVHEEKTLEASSCPCCGEILGEPVGEYERYVETIKPAKPHNKKYIIKRYWCRKCNKIVSRKAADAIPNSRFGIELILFVAFQRNVLNMPLGKIRYELDAYFGIKTTEASLSNALKRLAKIFGKEYQSIKDSMRLMKYVYFDDTSWRVNGKNAYLWDFINEASSLYIIAKTRSGKVAKKVLGKDYDGVAVSDFYPSFDKLPFRQQKCWLHILRKTRDAEHPEIKRMHKKMKRLLRDAVKSKDANKPPDAYKAKLLSRLDAIACKGYRTKTCRKAAKLLRKHRESMFNFLNAGIDYHNNNAERGLRNMVVMRKITGGSRSWAGADALAVNKTVLETWRKQGKDFFEYGTEYIKNELGLTS